MFKRQVIKDERIFNAQNVIYRELYSIIMVICIGSMVVKLILGMDGFKNIFAEMTILFVGAIYYLIRSSRMGIYSEEFELRYAGSKWKSEKHTGLSMIIVTVVGIVLGVIFGLNSALNYADSTTEAVKFFILVFIVTIMMYTPVMFFMVYVPHMVAKKKSERVNERMLEADEEEI